MVISPFFDGDYLPFMKFITICLMVMIYHLLYNHFLNHQPEKPNKNNGLTRSFCTAATHRWNRKRPRPLAALDSPAV